MRKYDVTAARAVPTMSCTGMGEGVPAVVDMAVKQFVRGG